ncbi:hypothetical protein [Acidithiobacillus sulfurivorans]|uniref:Uncharacterized protein n=1 Tax=Acidithiobacillus sulfurivorans TaxID=1958756 RepID=A0ABS5ZUX5_9PROT|nr:hypothetical protein [Acidithiobacillus sulfurivorans]MBU2758826.1 hypothetical protein [Acidithiobacillus sulfurivorans]
MYESLQENQGFIDDAKARGLDVLVYHDRIKGFMLLAGHPGSIQVLGDILKDYEVLIETHRGAQ